MIPAFLALVALAPLAAEPGHLVVPGDSRASADRLGEARRRAAAGKGLDAVELLQSLIEATGNDQAGVGDGRSVSARLLAHAVVAKLPPDALAAYRKRVDVQARRWLDQADATGAAEPLHRLVEEAFCTPSVLVGLDRLGDRAFERGRFDEAEAWWRRIAPLEAIEARQGRGGLGVPRPARRRRRRARAKQLLARIHRGHPGWRADLDAYRKRHPKAAGRLAGRTACTPTHSPPSGRIPQPAGASADWPAFGGGPRAAGWPMPRRGCSTTCRDWAGPGRPGCSTWSTGLVRTGPARGEAGASWTPPAAWRFTRSWSAITPSSPTPATSPATTCVPVRSRRGTTRSRPASAACSRRWACPHRPTCATRSPPPRAPSSSAWAPSRSATFGRGLG
ncbi:MAG: hypothetical protein U0797_12185 [Gemmataceae bacterium]